MKDLDYSKLQPLSANNSLNKSYNAKDNDICKQEIENYLNNFREYLLSQNVYDTASLLIAEQDWLKRKDSISTYKNVIGKILKIDFGKTYNTEIGYIHYGLCISEFDDKYLVIPLTTANDEIKASYHPKYRVYGKKRLFLLKKEDGNTQDSALYMNDARYITGSRIIGIGNKIAPGAYNNIIQLFFEISCPQLAENFKTLVADKESDSRQILLLKEIIEKQK